MKSTVFDSIIVGGGCSGLSLALALAKRDPKKTILILESRKTYIPDRTWCFWNVHSHPYEKLIDYKWKRWQVRFQGQSHSMRSDQYEYHLLSSARFYEESLNEITKNPLITLLMDVSVSNIIVHDTCIEVQSSKGTLKGHQAYDSRPETAKTSLYQHFLGWHVSVDHPIFDPEEIVLMDFDVDQSKGLSFMYVLPFSPYEALLESTYISPHIHANEVYEEDIRRYLIQRFSLHEFGIIRQERGVLPLGIKTKANPSRIIPIGAKAGWMRASTGYAFLSIQEQIASLLEGKSKTKKMEQDLDRIFLSFLKDCPKKAPEVFFQLFQKSDPNGLVRFLSGNASYKDTLNVILNMPKIDMLKQVFK